MLTVVGDTSIDIFVRGVSRETQPGEGESGPPPGPFIWARDRVVPVLGGSGANTAYVSATLGEMVRLWSALGADPFGDMILGWLHGREVDTTSVRIIPEAGTATTIVIVGEQSGRQTYYYPGASGVFAPRALVIGGGGEDWLLVTGYSLLPGWRGDNAVQLLRVARNRSINTALDFGPLVGQPVTADELERMLPSVHLLLCHRSELEQVSGRNMRDGASWALDAGAEAVVVRANGADVSAGDDPAEAGGGAWVFDASNRRGVHVPGFDTRREQAGAGAGAGMGAGDSFNAGLLFARKRGASLEESVRFANATAAIIVGSPRGVLDAPNEQAVRDFLAGHAGH